MRVLGHVSFVLWLLACGFGGIAAQAGDGVPAGPGQADQAAIRQVIERQLDAFRRDDGAAAFAFAAPGIKALFGNPENFMAMVRSGYQPLYRPKGFSFEPLTEQDGMMVQRLRVVGADGKAHLALYTMERQADGRWLIAGCVLLDLPEESV
ncbi:MAG TPA: DUF4864 domain-containing protein [Candidatus Sulfotelmatobacter sp.]|nr:DUF4864 domain-containing protein [Candidatus Sulfotelmatobacter sp.]